MVAVSTSMPQYKALYSQGRELAEYMLKKMEFTKVGTFYGSAFPPEALVRDDGLATLPECSFYLGGGKKKVLLFAGDTSPMEEQYAFAKAMLKKSEEFGVRELYS
ncbi:MAG TPA: PAC2 family protein, partial [Nitrososphaerales archaeon]|nr:PAC2 family protein [Nitrososphaerales archaeon]